MAGQSLFFVDTNILVRHLRQQKAPTILDLARAAFGRPVVSEITIFELEVGARRANRMFDFHRNFNQIRSYPLTLSILMTAAQIQADLLAQNQVIGLLDTFIASTAIEHDLPLFTLNKAHFERVDELSLLNLPQSK